MPEGQAPDATTSREPLPPELSDRLKACGFDPGIPVDEITSVDFDLDHVKRALFDGTYQQPVQVTFRSDKERLQETPIGVGLPMVVELVQAVYVPLEPHAGSGLFGCINTPDWYLGGFLYKSGYDPYPEIIRMHAYLEVDSSSDGGSTINSAIVQVVRHTTEADQSAPLVFSGKPPSEDR
jgi:hypothetical protein